MERCLSGHLYAMTRGDEECPVCVANKVKNDRIAELERQLEAERAKVAEEIAEFVEKEEVACVGVLWPEEDAELTLKNVAAAIRAKYLQGKPAPEVKP